MTKKVERKREELKVSLSDCCLSYALNCRLDTHLDSRSLSDSSSLVLVKPRKDMNNVSCRCDITEILLKAV